MRIDFGLRRRKILRPVVPTQAQENELYSIFLDSVRIWSRACAQIADAWTVPVLTTDDISENQIQWIVAQAQAQSESTIVYQTEKLGRWVTKVGNWHGPKTIAGIKSATGVDIAPFVRLADVRDLLDRSIAQNVSLIGSVNADTKKRVEQILFDGFATRKTKKQITDELAAAMGITKRRARLIAGDQLDKLNIALTGHRALQIGITSYRWKHTPQLHPRSWHVARDGKIFRYDEPPSDGPPGYALNCFPGSTEVGFPNRCNKLWRRHYSGKLIAIETGNGARLEATPNHPILTSRGWVAIGNLKQGDRLIKRTDSGIVGQDDVDGLKATFNDHFEAMQSAHGLASACGSKFDFHGDGSENDIDYINVTGDLPARRKSSLFEFGENLELTGSVDYPPRTVLDVLSGLKAHVSEVLSRQFTHCVMSLRGQFASLAGCHLGHADKRGVGLVSYFDTGFNQDTIDGRPGDIEPSRNGHRTFAAAVAFEHLGEGDGFEFDEVVRVSMREFNGHVFNASTDEQWYLANTIVAHNCKCRAEGVIDGEQD